MSEMIAYCGLNCEECKAFKSLYGFARPSHRVGSFASSDQLFTADLVPLI